MAKIIYHLGAIYTYKFSNAILAMFYHFVHQHYAYTHTRAEILYLISSSYNHYVTLFDSDCSVYSTTRLFIVISTTQNP